MSEDYITISAAPAYILVDCSNITYKGQPLEPGTIFRFGPYWCKAASHENAWALKLEIEIQKERGERNESE